MEEEGRQEAPRRGDDAEEVGGDEREPGTDGGDLHGVPQDRDTDTEREKPDGTNICSVCHEPWASSGPHRICCIPCGHVYGRRSCLELWLARSSRSTTRGSTAAAAKCLWCGHEFRREHMINLYGATENLLLLEPQQAATEEEQEQEEAPPAHDEAAAMEAEEVAAREWQPQAGHGHGHDLQEAAADAIARMNNEAAGVAVARRNLNGEAAAAAGFSWRNGAVAWKRVGLAWRIDAPLPLVADVDAPGDGDGAVAEAAAGAPPPAAAGAGRSSLVLVELGVGILIFIVAALLCLIM